MEASRIELNNEQLMIVEDYCSNSMSKLKKICHPIIIKIGGISKKDYDDIYSLAQFLLYKCVEKYDNNNLKGASFNTFFYSVLNRRLYATYIRDKNRKCRSNTKVKKNGEVIFIPDVSLDAPTPDCIATLERISISNNLEEEVIHKDKKTNISEKTREYLNNLTKLQRKVAEFIMEGYSLEEIKEILHMEQSEINDCMNGMKAYRNISILF